MLSKRQILLGITGGIAAYKSAELCRLFVKAGAEVQVVMSRAACEFITPLTLETLSGRPVPVEMFERRVGKVQHIDLAGGAEIMVVAPATADYLARAAQGRASDLISAVTLAFDGPIVAAPAMNTGMWNNPATRRNIETLSQLHGWQFAQPGTGDLACGWSGPGRMAEPAEILAAVAGTLRHDLAGRRIMVTAGPTVEDLDPVRFLGNRSTGRTGYAIAEAAARRGAEVILVSGPTALAPPAGVELVPVRSAIEMEQAVAPRAADCDGIVMTAAVADYRPAERSEHKLKKGAPDERRVLELVRNPDILAGLGQRFADGGGPVLVGFALETRDLEAAARRKLDSKGANLIVANLAADGFGGDDTRAVILGDDGSATETGPISKRALADAILDQLGQRLAK
jgi:phosphopantothenoylcysteine decarboxylase/phosphopantothenate--cysteine ligase